VLFAVIGEQIEFNELSNNTRGIAKLNSSWKEIIQRTNQIYSPLFTRKADVDHYRKVIALLERHQFILSLPSAIKNAIQQGDVGLRLKIIFNVLFFYMLLT
jgi:hypothetical protein